MRASQVRVPIFVSCAHINQSSIVNSHNTASSEVHAAAGLERDLNGHNTASSEVQAQQTLGISRAQWKPHTIVNSEQNEVALVDIMYMLE